MLLSGVSMAVMMSLGKLSLTGVGVAGLVMGMARRSADHRPGDRAGNAELIVWYSSSPMLLSFRARGRVCCLLTASFSLVLASPPAKTKLLPSARSRLCGVRRVSP
jgi:hypothetical protein